MPACSQSHPKSHLRNPEDAQAGGGEGRFGVSCLGLPMQLVSLVAPLRTRPASEWDYAPSARDPSDGFW